MQTLRQRRSRNGGAKRRTREFREIAKSPSNRANHFSSAPTALASHTRTIGQNGIIPRRGVEHVSFPGAAAASARVPDDALNARGRARLIREEWTLAVRTARKKERTGETRRANRRKMSAGDGRSFIRNAKTLSFSSLCTSLNNPRLDAADSAEIVSSESRFRECELR